MIVCIMMLLGLSAAISMGHKLPLQEEGACFSMFNYEYHVVQKIVNLEGSQDKNEKKIQTQQDHMTAANERLETMSQTLHEQSELLAKANEKITEMGEKLQAQMEQQTVSKEQVPALEERLGEMKQQIANLSSLKGGKQVVFTVYELKPSLHADGKTPTFDKTLLNTGSFDMSTGKFTCPTAGHYYFSFSMEHNSESSGAARCYFRVNGVGEPYV